MADIENSMVVAHNSGLTSHRFSGSQEVEFPMRLLALTQIVAIWSVRLVVAIAAMGSCAWAADFNFPEGFQAQQIEVEGGTQYVRVGGQGAPVLLLHGFGDTGDMWAPLAKVLMTHHTVIVPDLRGMGLSSHPDDGYTKVAQARDLAGILDKLHIANVDLVTHDIGNMVGYAFAALYSARVTKWVVMDAPLPGLGNWQAQLTNPKVWHFNFRGPDVERLVAGRERILLDRFYNELSANPAAIDEPTREHYAELYARPKAIHDAFSGQFAAFAQDAEDNKALLAKIGPLQMPVLALGGDHSYGLGLARELSSVASNVKGEAIVNSGHWIMEEQPRQAIDLIVAFIDRK